MDMAKIQLSNGGDSAVLEKELSTCRNLNASLREQLDQAHSENTTLVDENKLVRKKVASLQQEISNHNNDYSRLESEMFQQGQEVDRLKKENVGLFKNRREIERKLREETLAFEGDRSSWQDREAELVSQVKALQETVNVLAQQNEQASQKKSVDSNDDSGTNSGSNSPASPEAELAAYTSSREVKQAQQKIKEQDQVIKKLRDDVYNSNKEVAETTNVTKTHVRKIQQLEMELREVKDHNSSLMEENESFQLLLHEKTIKGEFVLNPILQHDTRDRRFSKPTSPDAIKPTGDLAAELDRAKSGQLGERVQKESERNDEIEKLQDQIKSLEKDNKSLNLYIQKILNRIMEVQGFEQLLSTDWSKQTFESNPSTPTVTTFGHTRTQSTAINPVTPTDPVKKIERRKTLSGPPQRPQIKILPKTPIDEQEDQLSPLPLSPTAARPPVPSIPEESPTPRLSDPPARRRRNSQSGPPEPKKRWSLFGGWGANAAKEEKKEDPHLKPMLLLQDKGRVNG